MELRQLRYFVTLAEELHFGRAAAREHIVQSALSHQVQRLERTLGVVLVVRNTRHIELTEAGARFLSEARQILSQVERATAVALGAADTGPVLRIGVLDEGYEAVRPVLHQLFTRHPEVEVHLVHAGVPEQCRGLLDGSLDAGVGRASAVPPEIATELFRLDPLGILVADGHRLAGRAAVPVSLLAGEPLLLPDERQAPESVRFLTELCRSSGFFPNRFRGSVQGLRAGADLVARGCCSMVVPESAVPAGDVRWRPLVQPTPRYPWSLLWRAHDVPDAVSTLVATARCLSRRESWRAADVDLAG
ncbi:LysR family transcriptional regulator [Paractinoplanes atraurantiacus]|uniref:DNA-binding transcriptional regulator, LysR family n=1 Tax=Paractinoplanes atraurantiacus TaxID=1036182 RepID=A0A285GQL3_9ACTN|nr:LysR substrate-binding domain-containing protein [Actinoplanes atraurantiacus]SNY24631.1 DNA-binding transcriptional regulator, LysR family [Actinoplanes atraurantiacus]